MAIATVATFTSPSPRADEAGGASLLAPTAEKARYAVRRTAAASADRVPPRVYTPYPLRRLTRPMAVRAHAEAASAVSGRTRLPLFRGRRDRTG